MLGAFYDTLLFLVFLHQQSASFNLQALFELGNNAGMFLSIFDYFDELIRFGVAQRPWAIRRLGFEPAV